MNFIKYSWQNFLLAHESSEKILCSGTISLYVTLYKVFDWKFYYINIYYLY